MPDKQADVKKKILFVLPHYHAYLKSNANEICIQKIIKELVLEGHNVDILCTDNLGQFPLETVENGARVISLTNEYNKAVCKYGKRYNATKWAEMPNFLKIPVKIKCYLKSIARIKTDYYAVDAISRRVMFRYLSDDYDIVISHSFPFAAHTIAREVKNRGFASRWVAIMWDPYVYNGMDPVETIPKRKKVAEKVLQTADGTMFLDGIVDENIKNGYNPAYQDNSQTVVLPTLENKCLETTPPENDSTMLLYAGAFYRDIRNPSKMLDILCNLPKGFTLQLFGNGCRDIIKKKAEQFVNCTLVDHGVVSHDECLQAIMRANILINFGNTVTNQLPSKVFEYICFGKPIINFYQGQNDLSFKYLRRYPLAFHLNINDYNEAQIEDMIEFCKVNKNRCLTYDEATANMKEFRADTVVRQMCDYILGNTTNDR